MYGELDRCETRLLVDGGHGVYVPKIFAKWYGEDWGVHGQALEVLRAGPEHEDYWEVWGGEVLDFAEHVDEGGKKWFLAQTPEGDLFACHRLPDPDVYLCPDCHLIDQLGDTAFEGVYASENYAARRMEACEGALEQLRETNQAFLAHAAPWDKEFSHTEADCGCGAHTLAGARYAYRFVKIGDPP